MPVYLIPEISGMEYLIGPLLTDLMVVLYLEDIASQCSLMHECITTYRINQLIL